MKYWWRRDSDDDDPAIVRVSDGTIAGFPVNDWEEFEYEWQGPIEPKEDAT